MNIITDKYQIERVDDFTLHITFRDNVKIDRDSAVQLDLDSVILMDYKPYVLLIEARNINSYMTGDALSFLANESESRSLMWGCAMLVNNLPIRLIAKLYIRFHKPPYPSQIFSHAQEANKWLESISSRNRNQDQIQI